MTKVLDDILAGVGRSAQHALLYTVYLAISMGASLVLSAAYYLRYRRISRQLPKGYSEDIRAMMVVLVALCGLNFVISAISPSFLIDPGRLKNIFTALDEDTVRAEVKHFFIGDMSRSSEANTHLLHKDIRFFAFAVGAKALLHGLSHATSKVIEYISFLRSSTFYHHKANESSLVSLVEEYDFDKLIAASPKRKHKKSVSFDSTLTTFKYSSLKVSVTDSKISRHHMRIMPLVRHVVVFVALLAVYLVIVPSRLLTNSSSIILEVADHQLRFDHVLFAINTMFLWDVAVQFVRVANHPHTPNFPKLTSMLSHFTWCYCCLVFAVSVCVTYLMSDVLLNIVGLIILTVVNRKLTSTISFIPQHIFTQGFLDYLRHSVTLTKCGGLDVYSCSNVEYIDALSAVFVWTKTTLTNCWLVANGSCFLLFPMVIWLLTVEFKIGFNRSEHL